MSIRINSIGPQSINNSINFNSMNLNHLTSLYIGDRISNDNKALLLKNIDDITNLELLKKLFFKAIAQSDLLLVSALVNTQKIDINIVDEIGCTALFYSTEENNIELTDFLLQNKAKVNIKNNFDDTPLMFASIHSSEVILEKLLFADWSNNSYMFLLIAPFFSL